MFWHSLNHFYGYFTNQFNTYEIHSILPKKLLICHNASTSLVECAFNN